MTFGVDPLTATIVTTAAENLLSRIFGSSSPAAPAGPSTEQIALAMVQQQRAADARRNAWLIGLALAAAGVGTLLVLRRK